MRLAKMFVPAVLGTVAAVALVAGAAEPTLWDAADAAAAAKIEVQVDEGGAYKEVEFHVAPDAVPEAVRKAMDALHPGGEYTDAEKERAGGVLYWELCREVDGYDVEAMFTEEGKLHSEEIEVGEEAVPDAVREIVAKTWPDSVPDSFEEIKDGDRKLVEYHVKIQADNKNFKVTISPAGKLLRMVREVPAEIEVPVPLP